MSDVFIVTWSKQNVFIYFSIFVLETELTNLCLKIRSYSLCSQKMTLSLYNVNMTHKPKHLHKSDYDENVHASLTYVVCQDITQY